MVGTGQPLLEVRRSFNWGIVTIGDAEATEIPDLPDGMPIGFNETGVVAAVRHAQDIEVLDEEESNNLFEVTVRLWSGQPRDGGHVHSCTIDVPSGRISVGDADSESFLDVAPGRWLIQTASSPVDHAETLDVFLESTQHE